MRYPGGKNGSGTYQTIINEIPPHRIYIEPFAGSAAIFRHKRRSCTSILIDADAAATSKLTIPAGTNQHSDAFRNAAPIPVMVDSPLVRNAVRGDVPGAIVITGDAISFLKTYGPELGHGTFIYLDPPYPIESRSTRARIYQNELTDTDHAVLLDLITRCSAMIMISSYENPLYSHVLAPWRHSTFQAMNRAGKMATEHLWMNYPAPRALHDYRYLGSSYRQRERIKRKLDRWQRRIRRLGPLEQQAIIQRLTSAVSDE